jgi:hypothetical protein
MSNYPFYLPSEEEITEECIKIRANRAPDVKVPMRIDDYIKLYVNNSDFIQEQAEKDGMPIDDMLKDETYFIFYLINKSLGSSDNFHCADCGKINDGFSKLCQKCAYRKSAKRKRDRKNR